MNRCELLSPAGDFSCMTAAFAAGADAVYLAGKSFGARAFAGNFETDELVEALDYAHLQSKKIYLTLNTLIKEKEFGQIVDYLTPFYEHGLDGVIIQDLGLIPFLKREFPLLELHGSTQMTVSNYRSAAWLKKQGICRVVPARELSLEELKEIKEKAQIEVEAFIHGAMCYCYSGQCLFSSFLGGRSGNRGRCAQPCRLPYKVLEGSKYISGSKDVYPLSLKDLCSIPYIYELLDAGIDSFKIEGRMKSPEYVAGVTAVYRKYIDAYVNGECKPVDKEDMEQLAHLYIRSDMKDGYFKKHNGKDMISLWSPSYQGCDDGLVKKIHDTYCDKITKTAISGVLKLITGKPAELTVFTKKTSVTTYGEVVQQAQNRPLTKEDVEKQVEKTGSSSFVFDSLVIEMDGNVFLPVKKINELRRTALEALKNELLCSYMRTAKKQDELLTNEKKAFDFPNKADRTIDNKAKLFLRASIISKEQLDIVLNATALIDRIYIPMDLVYLQRIHFEKVKQKAKEKSITLYGSLPRIIRKRDDRYLEQIKEDLNHFDGIQVKSLEGLAFLESIGYAGPVITDHSVYNWNKSSLSFMDAYRDGFTYPLELSVHENRELDKKNGEYVVYGRTPMMITANCVRKTMGCCNKDANSFAQSLQDRYRKTLPVYANCVHCYNEIYNAVPMSLHKEVSQLIKYGFSILRLDFTNETSDDIRSILQFYQNRIQHLDSVEAFPLKEYTQGHYKEGAV